jgi:hypothetical protein
MQYDSAVIRLVLITILFPALIQTIEMPCLREYQKLNAMNGGPGTRATATEPLLLPDEMCLAEDNNILFELYSQQEGFSIFNGRKDITIRLRVNIYLTNYRVHPKSQTH